MVFCVQRRQRARRFVLHAEGPELLLDLTRRPNEAHCGSVEPMDLPVPIPDEGAVWALDCWPAVAVQPAFCVAVCHGFSNRNDGLKKRAGLATPPAPLRFFAWSIITFTDGESGAVGISESG